MENVKAIKAAMAGLVGLLTGLWDWMGWLVIGWIGCMILDYISGTAAASRSGAWRSAKARDGIWHKAGMVFVVAVAGICDLVLRVMLAHIPMVALPFEYKCVLTPMILVWYIVEELGSVAENAAAMGAPVPKWLVDMLATAKEAVDKAGEQAAGEDEAKTTRLPMMMAPPMTVISPGTSPSMAKPMAVERSGVRNWKLVTSLVLRAKDMALLHNK